MFGPKLRCLDPFEIPGLVSNQNSNWILIRIPNNGRDGSVIIFLKYDLKFKLNIGITTKRQFGKQKITKKQDKCKGKKQFCVRTYQQVTYQLKILYAEPNKMKKSRCKVRIFLFNACNFCKFLNLHPYDIITEGPMDKISI